MRAGEAGVAHEAERRLEREYEPLKAETLRSLSAKLRARGLRLPDEDLDEYYNQAWHALYAQAASGTEIANTGGFLVQVAFRRAIDDLRRERRDERADVPLETVAVESDPVERLDDRRMLREFTEALRDELGERERVAASLCYVHGYTRPEAARLMGINERRMQKVMDKVSKAIGRIVREIQAGERCEARASANKAYALGLLDTDGERFAAARAHLDECTRCRADVLGLRGLASVAPAALLPWAAAHAAGGAGAGAAAAKKGRHGASSSAATAAVVLAVALAVAALAAVALTRGSSDPDRPPPPASDASSRGDARSSGGDDPSSGRDEPSSGGDGRSSGRDEQSSGRSGPSSGDRRSAVRRRVGERQRRAVQPAPPAVEPTVVATPAPTPAVTPAPTATPAPTVLDDGVQEFGVEP